MRATGITDLLESERGVFCILLLLVVTVLVFLGKLSGADWIAYTKWIAIALVASKTVTSSVEIATKKSSSSQEGIPTP